MKESPLIGAVGAVGFGLLVACSSGDSGGSKGPETTEPSSDGGASGSSSGGSSGASSGSSPSSGSSGSGSGASSGASSGAITAQSLVGYWVWANSPEQSFESTATFNADGTYEQTWVIPGATTGQLDEEIEIGTYTVSGALLTIVPTSYSCTGPASAVVNTISRAGTDIVLDNSAGEFIFAPSTPPSTPQSAFTVGCFMNGNVSTSAFTPNPVAPVP
jgi:hypothetical protein